MAKFELNKQGIDGYIDKLTEDKLNVVAGVMHSNAIKEIERFKDTGELMNKITWKLIKKPGESFARLIFYAAHAAIQEFGGTIKPRNAKMLAIPIHPSAKGKSPEEFDLDLVKMNDELFLVKYNTGDRVKQTSITIYYKLAYSVTIPAKGYARKTLYDNEKQYKKVFEMA